MPITNGNIRLQLLVNGEVICTAGLEGFGVLSAACTWVRRDPSLATDEQKAVPEFTEQSWIHNKTSIRLGGLDSTSDESLEWHVQFLEPGDRVSIRILPPGEFDEPHERYRSRCRTRRDANMETGSDA